MRGVPWETIKERLIVHTRVTPNARDNAIGGLHADANGDVFLAVRVSVPPEKGKANKSAGILLAKALKVPKSRVSLIRGETARLKVFEILPPHEDAAGRLEKLVRDHQNNKG